MPVLEVHDTRPADSAERPRYENHLKRAYRVERSEGAMIVTATSCYNVGDETLWLVESLPERGSRGDYLGALAGLGIERPEKVFDKLVGIEALRVREQGGGWKHVLGWILAPKLNLIPAALQERVSSLFGIRPQTQLGHGLRLLLGMAAAGLLCVLGVALLGLERMHLHPLPGVPHGLAVFALVLLGTLLHELGHSYAAAAGGIGFRPIGFSVYLFYPVFYTNVSGMEKLRIWRKLAVDCGGFIPQLAYLAGLFLLGLLLASPSYLEAVRWIAWLVAFNLNPLLRTDGYWIYHDLREEFRAARWMRFIHQAYLAGFILATGYLLWQVNVQFGGIMHRAHAAVENPRLLLSDGYKLVLGFYFIIMAFVGGLRRLQEGRKEWLSLREGAKSSVVLEASGVVEAV